jgi:hypothetical protein
MLTLVMYYLVKSTLGQKIYKSFLFFLMMLLLLLLLLQIVSLSLEDQDDDNKNEGIWLYLSMVSWLARRLSSLFEKMGAAAHRRFSHHFGGT